MQSWDASGFQAFVHGLSPRSRRARFWSTFDELPASLLTALTEERPGHVALVAEIRATARIVGEARFAGDEDGKAAEVAVVVDDEWQRRGIARQLLLTLHDIARADGYERLTCEIQANNDAMQALARTCGYRLTGSVGEAGGRRFEYHLRDRGA